MIESTLVAAVVVAFLGGFFAGNFMTVREMDKIIEADRDE